MNTYMKKTVTPKAELLTALDEATAQLLPKDVLTYVVGQYVEDLVETGEWIDTFKLQPRQPLKELKNYCRYHAGGCGVCMVNTGTCICSTPPALVHAAAAIACVFSAVPVMFTALMVDASCKICCESDACDSCLKQCCPDVTPPQPIGCGDRMPCARKDYRLNRSCCWDCLSLGNDCCCLTSGLIGEAAQVRCQPRNGPEAMFMD